MAMDSNALDRHITGNYGEDQFKGQLGDDTPGLRQALERYVDQHIASRKNWRSFPQELSCDEIGCVICNGGYDVIDWWFESEDGVPDEVVDWLTDEYEPEGWEGE